MRWCICRRNDAYTCCFAVRALAVVTVSAANARAGDGSGKCGVTTRLDWYEDTDDQVDTRELSSSGRPIL